MKNIVIIFLLALTFNACSTSAISISKLGNVNLHYDDEVYSIGTNAEKKDELFFSDLSIHQYKIITNNGNILFGEYAQTDLMYQFSKTELLTCMYIFDESKKYEMVYRRGNIQFVQVHLKNDVYVNVLIQANSLQDYYFLYGFSNDEFIKMLRTVKLKDTELLKPKFEGVLFNETSRFQTNWNDFLIYFTPLIEPLNDMKAK